jgi:serine/threonine-protein kinase HipA
MKRLIVYLNAEEVGTLEQDDSGLIQFGYSPEWLSNKEACPLSRTLPLQSEVFRGNKARPFFAGILPEDEPRRKIASILGISERNDFAMLERIGGECAGAVAFLPEGVSPPAPSEIISRKLSEKELETIVAELPRRPLMAGEEGVRLSLAGAQDKLPVVVRDELVSLPLGNTPSSHIIKPEPERFPGLVANELLCMALAKAVGLNVSNVAARWVGKTPCIIVQRYDRVPNADGTITRLHQEDFCQALGFPPERKYQQEGGPLLRDCISLLREWSTTPVLDIRDFVDGLIFNVLIGNADAHGKNYSLLYQGTSRRFAPLYDLVCTLAWPELSKALSMKIGKGKLLNEIEPVHFQKMAAENDLGWPMIRERMGRLCRKVLDVISERNLQFETTHEEIAEHVAEIVSQRASYILGKLVS